MNYRLLRPSQRFVGSLNEFVASLGQHLNRDVFWNVTVFDKKSHEVEVGLACRRKANLNFFVTHLDQQLKHFELALWAHRIDKRLVAVAKVNRAPARRFGDSFSRPGAVVELNRYLLVKWLVFRNWHSGCLLGVLHAVSCAL